MEPDTSNDAANDILSPSVTPISNESVQVLPSVALLSAVEHLEELTNALNTFDGSNMPKEEQGNRKAELRAQIAEQMMLVERLVQDVRSRPGSSPKPQRKLVYRQLPKKDLLLQAARRRDVAKETSGAISLVTKIIKGSRSAPHGDRVPSTATRRPPNRMIQTPVKLPIPKATVSTPALNKKPPEAEKDDDSGSEFVIECHNVDNDCFKDDNFFEENDGSTYISSNTNQRDKNTNDAADKVGVYCIEESTLEFKEPAVLASLGELNNGSLHFFSKPSQEAAAVSAKETCREEQDGLGDASTKASNNQQGGEGAARLPLAGKRPQVVKDYSRQPLNEGSLVEETQELKEPPAIERPATPARTGGRTPLRSYRPCTSKSPGRATNDSPAWRQIFIAPVIAQRGGVGRHRGHEAPPTSGTLFHEYSSIRWSPSRVPKRARTQPARRVTRPKDESKLADPDLTYYPPGLLVKGLVPGPFNEDSYSSLPKKSHVEGQSISSSLVSQLIHQLRVSAKEASLGYPGRSVSSLSDIDKLFEEMTAHRERLLHIQRRITELSQITNSHLRDLDFKKKLTGDLSSLKKTVEEQLCWTNSFVTGRSD